MKCINKLRSKRGETLVETLASIVIIVVASMTMFYAIMTSARINRIAEDADNQYFEELNNAEQGGGNDGSGTVTIKNENGSFERTFEVQYTGGDGKLTSYELKEVTPDE